MKKTNKQKFQELSRKEKVDYIWEYYKLHIIGGIIVIGIIASFLNIWVFNPPPKPAVSVNFMSTNIMTNVTEELEKELDDLIVTEEMGNKKVFVNTFVLGSPDPQMEMATQTKFAASVQAQELDVMIMDKDKFEELAKQGNMLPLEEILAQQDLDMLSEKLISLKSEEDNKEKIYGIDVSDNDKINEIMVGDSPKVMSIIVNSQKLGKSKEVIKWFLDIQ
ncbi:hypothetical protein SH1V18_44770 [Vallitalea longa]|uniref:Uncharacterized protein n=1 Tax=Vallitalea longa TaxID=2936439 RepID=A0A9W6DHW3_9FIRM|nr:hypothetical protein [Vallitalea longa]GKX31997.1 hypothetical protein SH1V18_44770 [Vallitalea longa]